MRALSSTGHNKVLVVNGKVGRQKTEEGLKKRDLLSGTKLISCHFSSLKWILRDNLGGGGLFSSIHDKRIHAPYHLQLCRACREIHIFLLYIYIYINWSFWSSADIEWYGVKRLVPLSRQFMGDGQSSDLWSPDSVLSVFFLGHLGLISVLQPC